MRKRNGAVILSLALALVCCSLTGFAAQKEEPSVDMEVSSTYGEIGKMGVHVPLSVDLYCHSAEPFTGTLSVQTLENGAEEDEEVYEYQYPVEIATAETKTVKLYVPIGQRSNEIHVSLKDEEGKTVLTQTMHFEISKNMGRLLIGVLSDHVENLSYLDGVSLNYGMVQSEMLELDEESLPDDAKGLELLDLLIINRYDTDRLSDQQLQAVKAWVEDGGTLLFGTGATVYSTLGPFAEELVELPIGGIFYENINLGTEYAEKAPGDAEVHMAYADLWIPEGTVEEESDGIPLLTTVKRGSGRIGIYSYSLDDIAEFVDKNQTYAVRMLTDLLDEETISMLYYYSAYGDDDEYWNAYSLVNTGSAERLPNLGLYTAVIAGYIVLVGPGLYLFLKKKDMSRVYGTAAVITSVAAAAIVYLLGAGTRFTSQFFQIASIMELDGGHMEETSYLNVQTPDRRPFSVTLPASYEVMALTRSSLYNEQTIAEFKPVKDGDVKVRVSDSGTTLSAKDSRAFEPRFFKLVQNDIPASEGGITGRLVCYDGKISGTVENHFPFALEDAALILYGQMYRIGEMEPGAVLNLQEEELMVWPADLSYVAGAAIVGTQEESESSNKEYLEDRSRSSLYSYYLGKAYQDYTSKARLVAIGPEGGILSDDSIRNLSADGTILYSASIPISAGEEGLVYRSALKNKPEVKTGSGVSYGDGLSMYGSEPVIVEYFLGESISLERLSFLPVSEWFLENPDYYYLKRFDGAAFFYNQTTRSYDRVDLSKIHFTAEELRPYLSAEKSITVKYTAGEEGSEGNTLLLPHLMVTGREG